MNSCTSCKFFGLWTKECYKSKPKVDFYTGNKTYQQAEVYRFIHCNGEYYQENNTPKLKFCNQTGD